MSLTKLRTGFGRSITTPLMLIILYTHIEYYTLCARGNSRQRANARAYASTYDARSHRARRSRIEKPITIECFVFTSLLLRRRGLNVAEVASSRMLLPNINHARTVAGAVTTLAHPHPFLRVLFVFRRLSSRPDARCARDSTRIRFVACRGVG